VCIEPAADRRADVARVVKDRALLVVSPYDLRLPPAVPLDDQPGPRLSIARCSRIQTLLHHAAETAGAAAVPLMDDVKEEAVHVKELQNLLGDGKDVVYVWRVEAKLAPSVLERRRFAELSFGA